MIVLRFKATCLPEKAEEFGAALGAAIAPSRATLGVLKFDIARALDDPNTFVAVEVFEDRDAMKRQDSLPEAQACQALMSSCLAGRPECDVHEVPVEAAVPA